jgi:hypothetical protein
MGPDLSPAVERGIALMKIPMRDLPPEAFIFCGYMCKRYMMCMEVMLTAYCYYAQIVEGLSCDDDLYLATTATRAEWEEVQNTWERVAVNGKIIARPRSAESP